MEPILGKGDILLWIPTKIEEIKIGDARIFMLPDALSPTMDAGSPVEFQFNGIWFDAEQPEIHKVGNEDFYEVANLRRVI